MDPMFAAVGGVPRPPRPALDQAAAAADPPYLVAAATSEMLNGIPDWTVNMQIVDLVQTVPSDAVVVMNEIKRQLTTKKHAVGLLTVILLETLVKNCQAVHPIVGNREFVEAVLVKSLPRSIRKPHEGPSLNSLINESDVKSPLAIQRWEAILKLIQSWAAAFNQQQYPIFHEVHRMLERRGVRFPPVDKEENAPVFMKPKPNSPPASAPQSAPAGHSSSRAPGSSSSAATSKVSSTQQEIKGGIEAAQLLTQMLDNAQPDHPFAEDELIQQLYNTCRSSAGMLSNRLTRAANSPEGSVDENVMMALISAHETVQESIKYYEDIASGVKKPGQRGNSSSGPRLNESKEDEGRPGKSSAPPAASDFFSASTPQHTAKRKDSELADLSNFDLLGIGSSAKPAAQAPAAVADPFASFPAPNMFQSPATSAPHAAAATPSAAAAGAPGSSRKSSAILAPPPDKATRSRKESVGKRDSGSNAAGLGMVVPAAATVSSPAAAAPPNPQKKLDDLFNLDLLMANNSPALTTPRSSVAAPAPTNSSALPFTAASGNVFDSFAPPATSAAFGARPAAAQPSPFAPPASNPFAAFDSPPVAAPAAAKPQEDDDPFAALANRSVGSAPKANNGFGF